jgi:hypothetical protein
MIYHGHIENGHIVFDRNVSLPEGVRVVVQVAEKSKSEQDPSTSSARQLFGSIRSGDPHAANNDSIDGDLARAYAPDSSARDA